MAVTMGIWWWTTRRPRLSSDIAIAQHRTRMQNQRQSVLVCEYQAADEPVFTDNPAATGCAGLSCNADAKRQRVVNFPGGGIASVSASAKLTQQRQVDEQ